MNGLNIKLFNQGTAIQAVEMIRPAVECLMEADVIKRKALAVNIPDPATGEVMYAGRIVLDEEDWQDRFAMLAKGKAGQCPAVKHTII